MIGQESFARYLLPILIGLLALAAGGNSKENEACLNTLKTERPVVTISQGKLEGVQKESRKGRSYSSFLGIPFGKSTRFQVCHQMCKCILQEFILFVFWIDNEGLGTSQWLDRSSRCFKICRKMPPE